MPQGARAHLIWGERGGKTILKGLRRQGGHLHFPQMKCLTCTMGSVLT